MGTRDTNLKLLAQTHGPNLETASNDIRVQEDKTLVGFRSELEVGTVFHEDGEGCRYQDVLGLVRFHVQENLNGRYG